MGKSRHQYSVVELFALPHRYNDCNDPSIAAFDALAHVPPLGRAQRRKIGLKLAKLVFFGCLIHWPEPKWLSGRCLIDRSTARTKAAQKGPKTAGFIGIIGSPTLAPLYARRRWRCARTGGARLRRSGRGEGPMYGGTLASPERAARTPPAPGAAPG